MSDLTDFYSELDSKQRDNTVRRFYVDQHGRRFFAWADKQNQRPIGEFVLSDITGRFETPKWIPPMSYIQWQSPDALEFSWDYSRIADELAGVTALWYDEAQKLAKYIHVTIPEVGGVVVPELLGILGPPPLSPEIPIACEAGERWLLGVRGAVENKRISTILHLGRTITSKLALDTIRERVRLMIESGEIVPIPGAAEGLGTANTVRATSDIAGSLTTDPFTISYRDFIGAAMKRGDSMADAAVAWKAHRENIALEGAA